MSNNRKCLGEKRFPPKVRVKEHGGGEQNVNIVAMRPEKGQALLLYSRVTSDIFSHIRTFQV